MSGDRDERARNGNAEAERLDARRRLDEIRALLTPVEWGRVDELEDKVASWTVEAEDVGRVLPEALVACRDDERFELALQPTVEAAIEESVRRDPQVLIDAIFPVIGPAIRKAITSALRGMTENLNQLLERSLSLQALRWRLEAKRTGVPFAELLLLKTLVYRVEQVFLVHRETGLCMLQAAPRAIGLPDADTLTGMLMAIQDFMRTSFDDDEGELHSTQMSERTLWIERGPHAALAIVIRGNPPQSLREVVRDALEKVHAACGSRLTEYRGDTDPVLESVQPYLESCLQASFVETEKGRRGQLVFASVLVFALAVPLLVFFDRLARERLFDAWRRTYVEAPGFVVTDVVRANGGLLIEGLRDPLAEEPRPLAPATDAETDGVTFRWHAYASLDSTWVLARVRRAADVPPLVELTLDRGRLVADGPSSAGDGGWADRLAERGPWIAGVDEVEIRLAVSDEETP